MGKFGVVTTADYKQFRPGKRYEVRIRHLGTNLSSPDYDYIAGIEQVSLPAGVVMQLEDPEGILCMHNESADPGPGNTFYAEGKTAYVNLIKADLVIEGVDDASEENPGGILPFNCDSDNGNSIPDANESAVVNNEDDLIEIEPDILPEGEVTSGQVKLEIISGSEKIKVWENMQKGPAPILDSSTLTKTWDLSSETPPDSLYVEGTGVKSAEMEIELKLTFIHDGNTGFDTVKFTIAPYLLIDNTRAAEVIYVSGKDLDFFDALDLVDGVSNSKIDGVPMQLVGGDDVWLQDAFEIGYSRWPEDSGMHMLWDLPRVDSIDNWAKNLYPSSR